ncbi:MAG: hypothetical protein ACOC32_02725 [Nanoarchaeota archaeon]
MNEVKAALYKKVQKQKPVADSLERKALDAVSQLKLDDDSDDVLPHLCRATY